MSSIYKNYKIKEAQILVIDKTGVDFDKFYLKEIWGNEDWSMNVGLSLKNFGAGIGYKPNIPFKPVEVHAMIINSIEDTMNLKFSPKIGVGVTVRVGANRW